MNQDEVPAVCETCLGPNPYLRMIREHTGLECKLCTRPFTVFKWTPVKNGAFKHTIICLTCAKQRNCCQSCLLDLTYGIPIQLRDAALKMAGVETLGGDGPQNEVSKLYVANNIDRFESIGGASITSNSDKAREILTKLALVHGNKAPKNGNKKKKEESSLPSHIEKVDVTKLVSKLPFNGSLTPSSQDTELKTLFIFGIDESLPEYKITDFFEKYGSVKSFNCQHRARCGFITYSKRSEAELAASSILESQKNKNESGSPGLVVIENIPMRVCWGKERPLGQTNLEKLKIGSIVGKIMKKLSKASVPQPQSSNVGNSKVVGDSKRGDKLDKKAKAEDAQEIKPQQKSVRKEPTKSSTNYKSASKNYEL